MARHKTAVSLTSGEVRHTSLEFSALGKTLSDHIPGINMSEGKHQISHHWGISKRSFHKLQ